MRYAETGFNLEVDLTRGNIERVETDPRDTELYLGGLGTNTKLLWEELGRMGMDESIVEDMGDDEVEDIFEKCMELTPGRSRIIGVGNIGGIGQELVYYFEARSIPKHRHDDSADGV